MDWLAFAVGAVAGVRLAYILTERRRSCRHDRIRTIYGDEINAYGGRRSVCRDCGAVFAPHAESRVINGGV